MINVLNGGKAAGSSVKFSKFYLIIDGYANTETNIPQAYSKFLLALKKGFGSVKGGESVFKVGPEGAFFNAFSTIAETFKQLEEAIAQSGANGVTSRPNSQQTKFDPDARLVFKIGINCDAESIYNKDPKDPYKYELEGSKAGVGFQQMSDFLINLCKEHPLLEYIEDPFAEADSSGYKVFKTSLAE